MGEGRPVLIVLAGLLLPALAGLAAPAGPGRSLAARRQALEEAEQRLLELVEKAREDPRMAIVERYLGYATPEEFSNPRREVRVADLADILKDENAPLALLERVRDALKSVTHRGLDPDLEAKQGRGRRAAFSRDNLVPLLSKPGDKAETIRAFAADILQSTWGSNDADILRYNPRDPDTWRKAAEAYRRRLKGP